MRVHPNYITRVSCWESQVELRNIIDHRRGNMINASNRIKQDREVTTQIVSILPVKPKSNTFSQTGLTAIHMEGMVCISECQAVQAKLLRDTWTHLSNRTL